MAHALARTEGALDFAGSLQRPQIFFFCFVCLQAFFRGKLPEMECYLQSATRKDHVGGFVALVEVTRDACLFLPAFQLLFLCWRLWMEIY